MNHKLVAFRCDFSQAIGSGHLYRCLSLAEKFAAQETACIFVCRNDVGSDYDLIRKHGHTLHLLQGSLTTDAEETVQILQAYPKIDLLILDHYSLDKEWESNFYPQIQTFVIDDLRREHLCHYLLDNNHLETQNPYLDKCPKDCTFFLGPQHSLLRNEFIEARKNVRALPKSSFQKCLIFFGSTDPSGETLKFINAAKDYKGNLKFTVIVTKHNKFFLEIQKVPKQPYIELCVDPKEMASLMLLQDFYFGSGGTVTWERMYLGLPGIVVSVADNQTAGAQALQRLQQQYFLGQSNTIDYVNALALIDDTSTQLSDLNNIRMRNLKLVSAWQPHCLDNI